MLRKLKLDSRETDALRLDDLSQLHHLPHRKKGNTYCFEDFNAYGLEQALGYAEGYDRAMARVKARKAADVGRHSQGVLDQHGGGRES